jgi:hypothetical protein
MGSAEDVGRTGYLSVVMSVQAGNYYRRLQAKAVRMALRAIRTELVAVLLRVEAATARAQAVRVVGNPAFDPRQGIAIQLRFP